MCQADKADHGLDNFKVLPPSKDETAKTVTVRSQVSHPGVTYQNLPTFYQPPYWITIFVA